MKKWAVIQISHEVLFLMSSLDVGYFNAFAEETFHRNNPSTMSRPWQPASSASAAASGFMSPHADQPNGTPASSGVRITDDDMIFDLSYMLFRYRTSCAPYRPLLASPTRSTPLRTTQSSAPKLITLLCAVLSLLPHRHGTATITRIATINWRPAWRTLVDTQTHSNRPFPLILLLSSRLMLLVRYRPSHATILPHRPLLAQVRRHLGLTRATWSSNVEDVNSLPR